METGKERGGGTDAKGGARIKKKKKQNTKKGQKKKEKGKTPRKKFVEFALNYLRYKEKDCENEEKSGNEFSRKAEAGKKSRKRFGHVEPKETFIS